MILSTSGTDSHCLSRNRSLTDHDRNQLETWDVGNYLNRLKESLLHFSTSFVRYIYLLTRPLFAVNDKYICVYFQPILF